MGRHQNQSNRYQSSYDLFIKWIICSLIIALSSCNDTKPSAVQFRDLYYQLQQHVDQVQPARESQPITLSASGLDMSAFIRRLVDLTGSSVVVQTKYDSDKVTGEFRGQSIDKILTVVARRLGCELTKIGTVYYLGDLKSEDKAIMVKKVRRLPVSQIGSAAASLISETGKIAVTDDGLLIVADRVQVLSRIQDMVDQVEATPSNAWITQIWLMSLGKSSASQLGLDNTSAVKLSLTFQKAASVLTVTDAFTELLHTVYNSSDSKMVAEPMMLLIDGNTGTWHSGETVPIAQKTVSQEGTVSTSGYTNISTGLDAKISLRELNLHQARLDVVVSNSSINGYVDNAVPIIDSNNLTTELVVDDGGTYLAGLLSIKSVSHGWSTLVHDDSSSNQNIQVWLRAYPVSGPARKLQVAPSP